MKGIWIKAVSTLMAAITICSLIAGCTTNVREGEEEKTVLNVWHQWANETTDLKRLYDRAVADYMKENPNIIINTSTYGTEAYKLKIHTEFTGSAKDIDVFYWWGEGTAQKFVDADKLLPLDDYITDDIAARIIPGSTSSFEFDGHLYSVPMFSWYLVLFCNEDIFNKAGAALPDTYERLLTAVKRIKDLDGVTPIASGANTDWNSAFIYQAMALRCVGAENINKMARGQAGFDHPGYLEAAQKVVELYNAGAFGSDPLADNSDNANLDFIKGKAAMRFMGSWFANQIYSDANISIDPSSVKAMKVPVMNNGNNPNDYCGGFVESFWVNKSTSHPDQAAKFCLYINERLGVMAYESGAGLSGWNTPADQSKINPLFIEIKKLQEQSVNGVLAWDTLLDSETAKIHNQLTQSLFSSGADTRGFVEKHKQLIKVQ